MVLTKDSRASVRLIKISSPLAPSIRSLMIPSKCCHPFVVPVQLACPIKSWSPNWYLTSCVHVLQAGANQVVPQAVCRPADDGINMHEHYISNPQSRVRIKTYKIVPGGASPRWRRWRPSDLVAMLGGDTKARWCLAHSQLRSELAVVSMSMNTILGRPDPRVKVTFQNKIHHG
jgi:hypothetical protein